MDHDLQGWRRWIPVLTGLGLTSLIMWMAQGALHSPRGATGPTMLLAERPVVALLVVFGCFVLAFGVATAVARLVNAVTGLFVLGWGLAILTMRCETMREVALTSGLATWLIVFESLLWAIAIFGATVGMLRLAGMPHDLVPDPDDARSHALFSSASLKGAAAGALIVPAMWLIAQSEMKGQVFASAFFGALAAGLVGRLLSPHGSPVLLMVTPCLAGAIGQAIGLLVSPAALEDAHVLGAISPLVLVSPLDLAAGSLTGASLGIGWARSFLQHQPAPA